MADGRLVEEQHEGIARLAGRVQQVDIRAYESMPLERLVAELPPVVSQLLGTADALVSSILQACDEEPPAAAEGADAGLASPYVPFEQAIDSAIGAQSQATYRAVGDIAFLGQLELRQRRDRLARVVACNSEMAIIGECDGALRRVRKVLTALDRALARAGLAEARLDFATELELSLRVRRACAKFRARIVRLGEPAPDAMLAHLRSAGTTIAMLVGWDTYPLLRVRDRLQLRDLQRRLLHWLRSDHDAIEGGRLWQDLVAFVGMLAQVNRRQELVEHDARVIREARAGLGDGSIDTVPAALLASLGSLEGLDEEIDALLASSDRARAASWRAILEKLGRLLGSEELPS